MFWRKNKNVAAQEQDEQDDKLLHPEGEPALEPSTDYDPEMDEETREELEGAHDAALDDVTTAPAPAHNEIDDARESEEFKDDSNEGGWLSRLTGGLSKSSKKLSQGISDLLTKKKLDQETLDDLEELLIAADLGPATASKIISAFAEGRMDKDVTEEEVKEALAAQIAEILTPVAKTMPFSNPENGPFTVLVCGVNGVGKTTTVGKLAQKYHMEQKESVLLAAGDTFRAAAVEQLEVWAARTHSGFFAKDIGADAAAVAYESYQKAQEDDTALLMIDTAGRLHNKANLMAELEKVVRVLKKQDEALPHEILLVLDATTGQNAVQQVETFKDMINITGLIVTKLDGSARGGIVVSLADQFGLPIYAVGVGETAEDLQPFDATAFARGLLGISS